MYPLLVFLALSHLLMLILLSNTALGATKSQIIIRRPTHNKPRPRDRPEEDLEPQAPRPVETINHVVFGDFSDSHITPTSVDSVDQDDKASVVKCLVRPPPIPGLNDWGIPSEPDGKCDPIIEVYRVCFLSCFPHLTFPTDS